MAEEDRLVSFFVYSLFVYPATNYIVAPQRKYPKWKGALYAVLFLLAVSALHMVGFLSVRVVVNSVHRFIGAFCLMSLIAGL